MDAFLVVYVLILKLRCVGQDDNILRKLSTEKYHPVNKSKLKNNNKTSKTLPKKGYHAFNLK